MDPQIQTSFIPKEQVVQTTAKKERAGLSILPIVSFIILFLAIATYGAAYLYKESLAASIQEMNASLAKKNSDFEKQSLTKYQSIDRRIKVAKKLISQHISLVPLFDLIEARTLQGVRFKNFQFSANDSNKDIKVKMSGEAKSYIAVAQQSDLFGNADDALTENVFTNIVFSNLNLDAFGNVVFDVTFSVSPRLLSYENPLNPFK